MIKLTKENFLKAGKQIMTDPRCDDNVKAAVRRSTDSSQGGDGMFVYHDAISRCEESTWYDNIVIGLGEHV